MPGVSHLNIRSFLEFLSSNAIDIVVASFSAFLFLSRNTSAMVTQSFFQPFRCTGMERILQMKLDVISSCSAACHDRGSLDIRQARNQSWGCGTEPLRSLSSSAVACNMMRAGASGRKNELSAILCPNAHSWALM